MCWGLVVQSLAAPLVGWERIRFPGRLRQSQHLHEKYSIQAGRAFEVAWALVCADNMIAPLNVVNRLD